jgi:aminopeptidase-like protein
MDNLGHSIDPLQVGLDICQLVTELFPICRSITGDGYRQSMKILQKHIPIEIYEIPSNTQVFDWIVPKEWNIKDAYIKNAKGEKIVDFKKSNLHILGYSSPIAKKIPLQELKPHLFSLPEHPSWIPYKTSYYQENWGFCITHNTLMALENGEYEVLIDSTIKSGHLTYGELYIEGTSKEEVLISCHCCHPSLANDNLSSIGVAVKLAQYLTTVPHRLSYRFVFIPGTIGAIAWLAHNQDKLSNIKHGIVLAGVGDDGKIHYKKSRIGSADIDKAALYVLKNCGHDYGIIDFFPYGYDERQYCSPGFNLPIGCLMRTPYGQYPEYHTSADNLDFVKPNCLGDSLIKLLSILFVVEHNQTYINLQPHGEPQLGKRGLYDSIGANELALLWLLNLSDGHHSLLDIAERSTISFMAIHAATDILVAHNLLKLA